LHEHRDDGRLAVAHYPNPKNTADRGACADKVLAKKAARYVLITDDLYKRGFTTPLLKCLGKEQSEYVMNELHNGICGMHSGHKTLAARIVRAGYY